MSTKVPFIIKNLEKISCVRHLFLGTLRVSILCVVIMSATMQFNV